MIDKRKTLLALEKQFPENDLETYFAILDCYVEVMPEKKPFPHETYHDCDPNFSIIIDEPLFK